MEVIFLSSLCFPKICDLYFLEHRNIVIVIALTSCRLMTSSVSFWGTFLLLNSPLTRDHAFLFLWMPGRLLLVVRLCKFCLVGAECFYIPINILEPLKIVFLDYS